MRQNVKTILFHRGNPHRSPHGNPPGLSDQAGAVKQAAEKQIAPRREQRWRRRAFQAYLAAAILAFAALFVLSLHASYFPADLIITRAVQSIHFAWFAALMVGLSFFGYTPQAAILVAVVGLLLLLIGLRWEALMAVAAAEGTTLLGELVKVIVRRPRPSPSLVNVLRPLNSYSFPSGHVLFYTAFFGFLFFLGYTLLKPSLARGGLLVVLGCLVVLVGVSRVYLGEHWASDVTGGYLLGSLCLAFFVYIYRWGKGKTLSVLKNPGGHGS